MPFEFEKEAKPMKRISLLAATALFATAPALAHNAWIKPSAASVAGTDGWVSFDAAASTNVFVADHQPMGIDMIKAVTPDGSEAKLENAMRGRYRTTFDLHLTQQGTWRVTTGNDGITGSYKLGGQEYRVGGRRGGGPAAPGGPGGPAGPGGPGGAGPAGPGAPGAMPPGGAPANFVQAGPDFTPPAGATEVKLTLTGARNEVFVTLGKPSEIKLSGKGLEMQPITHPADLVTDAPGQFRFLVDGKPAGGVEIEILPDGKRYRDDQGAITVKTDAQGLAAVQWPAAGLYWLHASFEDASAPRPGISGRRYQYTATLEVMAP
jgi:uncharacterized GH25 family protein